MNNQPYTVMNVGIPVHLRWMKPSCTETRAVFLFLTDVLDPCMDFQLLDNQS